MRSWVIRSEGGILAFRYSQEEAFQTVLSYNNRWKQTRSGVAIMKHPHLSDEVNEAISQSERDGGVWLKDIPVGSGVKVRTQNTTYEIINTREGWTIQGHPKMCPDIRLCNIHGSTWGGSMLKVGFLGVGMHIEMTIQGNDGIILTSMVKEIK